MYAKVDSNRLFDSTKLNTIDVKDIKFNMNKNDVINLLASCFLLLSTLGHTVEARHDENGFSEEIIHARKEVQKIMDNYPGLAVAVTVDGKRIWSEGFGFSDIKNKTPATADTPFNIYSVAKMLTGVAAARLAEQGLLNLDAPLSAVIEDIPPEYSKLTPRLLLGHLSGIAHYASNQDWEDFSNSHCDIPSDAIKHFIRRPLVSSPGEKHIYSTYGYVLLSEIIGRSSEQGNYVDYMRDEIFKKAGMTNTRLDSRLTKNNMKATPYEGSLGNWKPILSTDASCKFGGGGFLSSANDLASFGRAFYQNELLSNKMTQVTVDPFLLNNNKTTHYGFGMSTNTFEEDGRTIRWARHSGGSPGGRGFLYVVLSEKVSVGITANSLGPNLGKIASKIAYIFARI